MAVRLSTADVPALSRLEWLREVIGREYANVDIAPPPDGDLFNEMTITPWGDLQLSAIRSNATSLDRLPREPQLIGQDAYFAVILLAGEYRLQQDGREIFLRRGDLALYDAARPHRIDCPRAFKKLIVSIPREMFKDRLAGVEHCTALRIPGDTGIGAVTSDFIRACANETDTLMRRDFTALADYSFDLLTRALASVRPQSCTLSRSRRAALEGIKAYVERHLADPRLGAAKIASGIGLSTRYINHLFAEERTSLMRYVWNSRLERCRQAMLSASDGCSVSELAYRCGFNDPAHFSRVFKRRFGYSPRAYRYLHQCNQPARRRSE
jgi:AraC family transcriptional activator of tynA and feaB